MTHGVRDGNLILDNPTGGDTSGEPPLSGTTVLELTSQLSGPYAAMLLADLGAEVIKVEGPNRLDPARSVPSSRVGGESTYYLSLNRNKQSLLLDLKAKRGHDAFLSMVDMADVVLDNYRPGAMARLGLDHDSLVARNQSIITCSITGFGETGPDRDRPGYDYLMQALAGTMALTGDPGGPPTKYGVSVVDHVAGLFAVIGIQAALAARDKDPQRRGSHVDLGLLDTHLSMLSYLACDWLNGGELPHRQRMSAHPLIVGNQLYRTSDGYIVVMPLTESFFVRLCDAMEIRSILDDERFGTASARLQNRDELNRRLEGRFAERSTSHWLKEFGTHGVPAAPVQTVAEALSMEQVDERDMVVLLEHPTYGPYRMVGNPLKLSSSDSPLRPAPLAGENTRDVLRGLAGLTDQEVSAMEHDGICRTANR